MAAFARFAGSIVMDDLDPGACAPGFMLTRTPRANPAPIGPQLFFGETRQSGLKTVDDPVATARGSDT